MRIGFEWHDAKRRANLRKHGIDFADIPEMFRGDTVTVRDDRFEYGEDRYISLGSLRGRVIAVAHTERADIIRIISARKATRREAKAYVASIGN